MPAKPGDLYGTFGSIASVENDGAGGTPMSVRASPDAFGAQVGQATANAGAQGAELADHYAKMATEAKANDVIANKWAPAVAQLSGQYHEKQGIDAVAGLKPFQDNMAALHNQYLENASSPYEKQILSGYMTKHIAQEMDGAQRHQDQQLTVYEDQSHKAFVDTLSNNAVANYNNPYVVDGAFGQMDAQIEKHGIDRGQSPETIEQQQRQARGVTIQSMVGRAIEAGDINTANKLYADNREYIPGHMQLEIDKALHSENMQQIGLQNKDALLSGVPKPAGVGGPIAQQARVATAQAAQTVGIDQNHALTVLRIESNDGQNLGKRGDIGQTGKGGELSEQAMNLATELKKSDDIATKALGRPAEPWEGYTCYQQGAGGGPALLRAAQDNPTARAVEVLNGLYKNPKDALSAIVNNGGNATMTAGQYLDFIKQKYTAENARAMCTIPAGGVAPIASPIPTEPTKDVQTVTAPPSLADAIIAPSQTKGIPVQPGATPVDALENLNKAYPDALMRANQIPNLNEREATIKALEQHHALYSAAANAYNADTQSQVHTLAGNTSFTSMDQVPVDLRTRLSNNPESMKFLEAAAEHNLGSTDARNYGKGFYDLFSAVNAPTGDPNRITNLRQLQSHVGKNGDLTLAGYDKLKSALEEQGKPETVSESAMQKQTFAAVKQQIAGIDPLLGKKDPKGEIIFSHALPLIYKAIDEGKAKNIPINELYDPESKNWVGRAAVGLKRDPRTFFADQTQNAVANAAGTKGRSIGDIKNDVLAGKLTYEQGRAEAEKAGLVRTATTSTVPTLGD